MGNVRGVSSLDVTIGVLTGTLEAVAAAVATKAARVAALAWSTATPAILVPVNPTVSMSHGEKLEKFHGTDFKSWQQSMLFYLTTLSLTKLGVRVVQPRNTNYVASELLWIALYMIFSYARRV